MSRRSWLGLLVVLSAGLTACSDSHAARTQVIVLVNAEPEVREATTTLHLTVRNDEHENVLDEELVPDWEVKLALAPKDGDASRTYLVTAEALDDHHTVVARARLASGYVEGEKRFVVLLLEAACLGMPCPRAGDTCHAGACVPSQVRPDQLGRTRDDAPDLGELLEGSGATDAGMNADGGGAAGSGSREDAGGASDAGGGTHDAGGGTHDAGGMLTDGPPIDCGAPDAPDHGSVSTSNGTTYGRAATHACDTGYALSGDAERTCQADGSWSGTTPACVDVDACADSPVCTADFPCQDLAAPSLDYTCRGQHADFRPSNSPSSFVTNDDGTVTDMRNGLVWQETADSGTYTWDAAQTFCDDLELGRRRDWRLPARAELESLVDFAHAQTEASIDPDVFPGTPLDWFWSSSTYVGDDANAWTVVFDHGNTFHTPKTRASHVRCVRGGADVTASSGAGGAPPGRYVIHSSGTVDDTRTQLTWERVPATASYVRSAAITHCTELELDGGGWRLPTISELLTLVDPTRTGPAIDTIAFPGNQSDIFWAATAHATIASEGWNVHFDEGWSISSDTGMALRARCVR
jgi:hypothetical protein